MSSDLHTAKIAMENVENDQGSREGMEEENHQREREDEAKDDEKERKQELGEEQKREIKLRERQLRIQERKRKLRIKVSQMELRKEFKEMIKGLNLENSEKALLLDEYDSKLRSHMKEGNIEENIEREKRKQEEVLEAGLGVVRFSDLQDLQEQVGWGT